MLRELPFGTGDRYSARTLASARARLQAVDLLARAVVDVDSQPATDSTLAVRIQVQETRPRLTLAEVGYVSEGAGLTGRVQWTHPNFTGGARSLAASLEGQSGAGAVGTEAEQLLRASLNLTQPYVFIPRLSLIVGPYAEYRNDLKDQSVAVGFNTTLIHRLGPLSSIALSIGSAPGTSTSTTSARSPRETSTWPSSWPWSTPPCSTHWGTTRTRAPSPSRDRSPTWTT